MDGMAKRQRRRAQTRPYTADSCSYVSRTTTETTVTRTTTVTTIFPALQRLPPALKKGVSSPSVAPSKQCDLFPCPMDGQREQGKALPSIPLQMMDEPGLPATQSDSLHPSTVRHGLRKAASHSALSLARVSFGIGVTPAVPNVAPPPHLGLQVPVTDHSGSLYDAVHALPQERSFGSMTSSTTHVGQRCGSRKSFSTSPRVSEKDPTYSSSKFGRDPVQTSDDLGSNKIAVEKGKSPKRPLLSRLRVASLIPTSQRAAPSHIVQVPIASSQYLGSTERSEAAPTPHDRMNTQIRRSNHLTYSQSAESVSSSTLSPTSLKPTTARNATSITLPYARPRTPQRDFKPRRRSNTIAGGSSSVHKGIVEQLPSNQLLRSNSMGRKKEEEGTALGSLAETSTSNRAMRSSPLRCVSDTENGRERLSMAADDQYSRELNTKGLSEIYLDQLLSSVSTAEAVNILASSGGEAHSMALRGYFDRYNFTNEPIDLSLRAMLAETGLPKETQQIDRVLEAFAKRYCRCNPDVFSQDDHAYILAFSLIMLHTDAFNKSNKHKMTKADYIKNTQLSSISPQFLEYLYDNILFAPFVFLECQADANAVGNLSPTLTEGNFEGIINDDSENHFERHRAAASPGDDEKLKGEGYRYLTKRGFTPHTIDIGDAIPLTDPYMYQGTLDDWDDKGLWKAFAEAPYIEVRERMSFPDFPVPIHGLTVGGVGSVYLRAQLGSPAPPMESRKTPSEIWSLQVTKVGLLSRKDDMFEGGKRSSNRKWKQWSVILTGSQLLFFRDPHLAPFLADQTTLGETRSLHSPQTLLRPEEIISLKDCIAVYDLNYTKHDNTFRFVMPNGRHLLLRAREERSMNDWIHMINYASAFRSTGLRLRALTPFHSRHSSVRSVNEDPVLPPNDETVGDTPQSSPRATSPGMEPASNKAAIPDTMHSRQFVLSSKLRNLRGKITAVESELESNLRICRQYSLALPFQKNTRDKIQAVLPSLSKKVQSLRLELAKLGCYHRVLRDDLARWEAGQGRSPAGTLQADSECQKAASQTSGVAMCSSRVQDDEGEAANVKAGESGRCSGAKHHSTSSISSLSSVFSASNVAGWGSLLFPPTNQGESLLAPMEEE